MSPFVLRGGHIYVVKVNNADIRVGDIICYLGEDAPVIAHRVVSVEQEGGDTLFLTRGDARGEVTLVRPREVVGVVRRVHQPLFSYRTNGLVGQLFRWFALRDDTISRRLKQLSRKLFEVFTNESQEDD